MNKFAESLSLLLGLDYEREAPRRDNLDHYNFYTPGDFTYGPFTKVDSNNVTINSVAPYAAGSGAITHYFRYYAGWRRDQINIDNEDLINSGNSFQKWVGVNSPAELNGRVAMADSAMARMLRVTRLHRSPISPL